jgi:hypothetical protein
MDPKDHDLLIELRTEVKGMREDMRGQALSTAATVKDHENRIRALEQGFWKSIGALAVIQIAVQLLINHFFR